jgi:hypothetical protein
MTGAAQPAQRGHPAFIRYPEQAAFGRPLPKSKLYAHSGAGTRLKALFVQQVEQIVWQTKLAPETVNLAARPGVPEIQVFGIQLKTADFHLDVLRCIDQAVQFPIVFELAHAGRAQVVACYKRPAASQAEADTKRWVLSDYFSTGWLAPGAVRAAMPVALHLGGLYEQLLRALMPVPAWPGETLAEQVARLGDIAAKQREVDKVATQLGKERQFNRKVAINAGLRRLQVQLDALRSPR